MILAEEISCHKIKSTIFKTLAYVKNKDYKAVIEELVEYVNYSKALSSLLKEVNEVVEAESSSDSG